MKFQCIRSVGCNSHKANDINIKIFVIISSEGVMRARIDGMEFDTENDMNINRNTRKGIIDLCKVDARLLLYN